MVRARSCKSRYRKQYPCCICSKDCEFTESVLCFGCGKWVHSGCVGKGNSMSPELTKQWATRGLKFYCKFCCFDQERFDCQQSLLRFRVNGDLFSKRLMYMTWLREQDLPISEHLFQELFQHFSAMFGLDAIGAPGVKCETLRIGDVTVISTPDLVYYDFPKCSHDQGSKIFVVCEVNKDALKNEQEPSPPKRCRYEEGGQQQICHLSSELIGQHGGDLLAHFPCISSIQYGLFGFIVQCTSITFTHLDCSEIDFEQIRRGDPSFPPGTGPVIRFSQPYNFLKAEDRRHIIPPLLKLGFIKSYM